MIKLETIYSSNIPIDCHILKGRLESEGLNCFVFDENIVWIHPFRAVAIGGVKLKVPSDQLALANEIIKQIESGNLFDEYGKYQIIENFHSEYNRQMEVLRIKSEIRKNPAILDKSFMFETSILHQDEIDSIIDAEKEFQTFLNTKLNFNWKDFFYELFDFDRDVFKYLRFRPVDYFLDKEIVENYQSISTSDITVFCPNCKSNNTSHGYAIDYKWDLLYLILSLLFLFPFPLIRKKTHCFECGFDFKKQKAAHNP